MTSALSSTALLARLVGFDTTSSDSNLALIEWVADYLDVHGVKVHLTHIFQKLHVSGRSSGPRESSPSVRTTDRSR